MFGGGGTARLNPNAPDDALDSLLGIRSVKNGGITVTSSQHLPGDIAARGSSAFDGDPATAWSTAFGQPQGQWVEVQTGHRQPITGTPVEVPLPSMVTERERVGDGEADIGKAV